MDEQSRKSCSRIQKCASKRNEICIAEKSVSQFVLPLINSVSTVIKYRCSAHVSRYQHNKAFIWSALQGEVIEVRVLRSTVNESFLTS